MCRLSNLSFVWTIVHLPFYHHLNIKVFNTVICFHTRIQAFAIMFAKKKMQLCKFEYKIRFHTVNIIAIGLSMGRIFIVYDYQFWHTFLLFSLYQHVFEYSIFFSMYFHARRYFIWVLWHYKQQGNNNLIGLYSKMSKYTIIGVRVIYHNKKSQ